MSILLIIVDVVFVLFLLPIKVGVFWRIYYEEKDMDEVFGGAREYREEC